MARFSDVTQVLNNCGFSNQQIQGLREIFDMFLDREEVRAAVIDANFTALDTALDTLATKLNTDAGNTALDDTDYAGSLTAMGTAVAGATTITGTPS